MRKESEEILFFLCVLLILVAGSAHSAHGAIDGYSQRYRFEQNYSSENTTYILVAGGAGNSFNSVNFREGSYALNLSGSGYAKNVTGNALSSGNHNRTLTGWFNQSRAQAGGQDSYFFSIGAFSGTGQLSALMVDHNGKFNIVGQGNDALFTFTPVLNKFYFVCAVYNTSSTSWQLYVNGTINQTVAVSAANFQSNTNTVIGSPNADATTTMAGQVDDLRGYDYSFTAQDCTDLLNSYSPAPPAPANMTIQVNDTGTGSLVSGYSWNYTTTNASDPGPKAGYCSATNCTITTYVGTLNVTAFNITGPYGTPTNSPANNFVYNATQNNLVFNVSSNSKNLVLNLTNIVDGSFILNFCGSVTNGTNTYNKCTTTGTISYANISGNIQLLWFNTTPLYYNVSMNLTAYSGSNTTFTNSTYQALLNITPVVQILTNASISAFNLTNSLAQNTSATSGAGLIYANNGSNNVRVDVTGNFSVNVTCTVPAPLSVVSCTPQPIYDNKYNFAGADNYASLAILNFSLQVYNATLGNLLYNISTTNGSVNVTLLQGYTYFVVFSAPGGIYETKNASLPANAPVQYYQFSVLPSPAINITIRDASTGQLVLANMTITLSSNTTGIINYTTSGGFFVANIQPGLYSIKIAGANYTQNQYTANVVAGTTYYLTAYMQQNASTVVMQFVDSIASNIVLSGALVEQERLVNGSWVVISSRTTDITGRTSFGYLDGVEYQFVASATNYTTKQFDLNPVLFSSYTIKMSRTTALDTSEDYQSVFIAYTPQLFYDGRLNSINLTFSSPLGTFVSYNYTIRFPGGTTSGSGTNSVGQIFQTNITITGATILDKVNVTIGYQENIGQARSFSFNNLILISPGNTTFISNQNQTYGLGVIERVLIGTIIIVVMAGIITLAAGPIAGLTVALFIMGVFIKIGFWEWWLAGISFLVGIIIISARSD